MVAAPNLHSSLLHGLTGNHCFINHSQTPQRVHLRWEQLLALETADKYLDTVPSSMEVSLFEGSSFPVCDTRSLQQARVLAVWVVCSCLTRGKSTYLSSAG